MVCSQPSSYSLILVLSVKRSKSDLSDKATRSKANKNQQRHLPVHAADDPDSIFNGGVGILSYPILFSIFYFLFSIFYFLFSIFYFLFSIFYFLFSIFYFLFSIFYFLFSILFSIFYFLFSIFYFLFSIFYFLFSIFYLISDVLYLYIGIFVNCYIC